MKEKFLVLFVPVMALFGLIISGVFYLAGNLPATELVLKISLVCGSLPLLWSMLYSLWQGHFGVDIVAVTAIVVSLILHQYLAGTVIVLMMSGGEALESYALARASRELTSLLSRAPTIAHVKSGGLLRDIAAALVGVGDLLVVKPGESIPVDGLVISGISEVDESAITGESIPVEKQEHSQVFSGAINMTGVLEIRALKLASDSQYERIVKLVREAQESRAPIVRLADKYAVWFTILTFGIALVAWFVSKDPTRLLAVLVVATPCPLILATPIAVISGISWAASRGIIVKSGGALEKLGEAKSFLFDKTGTLTFGIPKVLGAEGLGISEYEVFRLAASLDQLSAHIFGRSLVRYAKTEGKLILDYPEKFEEFMGEGVSGVIAGTKYFFGKFSFLEKNGVNFPINFRARHELLQKEGKIYVYLSDQVNLLGSIIFADVIRPEMKSVFQAIKSFGAERIIMVTGDRREVAEKIAREVGITEFEAEMLPEQKVEKVLELKKSNPPVIMVGDGINDAPALASADVGIALGYHGATAAASAGDVVILVNSLERVTEALNIGRKVIQIAKQGIMVGIGLSTFLMVLAAFGFIKPVMGALLQEVIDVAVILNALRVHFQKRKNLKIA